MYTQFPVVPFSDRLVPAVWCRGQVHLHFTHPWRTSNLPAFQLHQVFPLCRGHDGKRSHMIVEGRFRLGNDQVSQRSILAHRFFFVPSSLLIVESPPWYSGWGTCQWLCWDCSQGQAEWAAAACASAPRTDWADPERAELPTGKRSWTRISIVFCHISLGRNVAIVQAHISRFCIWGGGTSYPKKGDATREFLFLFHLLLHHFLKIGILNLFTIAVVLT